VFLMAKEGLDLRNSWPVVGGPTASLNWDPGRRIKKKYLGDSELASRSTLHSAFTKLVLKLQ